MWKRTGLIPVSRFMKYRIIITKTKKSSHIVDTDSVQEAEHKALKECNEGKGEFISNKMNTATEKVSRN